MKLSERSARILRYLRGDRPSYTISTIAIYLARSAKYKNKLSNLFLVQDSGDTTSDNLKNIPLDEHIQIVSGFLMDDILLT